MKKRYYSYKDKTLKNNNIFYYSPFVLFCYSLFFYYTFIIPKITIFSIIFHCFSFTITLYIYIYIYIHSCHSPLFIPPIHEKTNILLEKLSHKCFYHYVPHTWDPNKRNRGKLKKKAANCLSCQKITFSCAYAFSTSQYAYILKNMLHACFSRHIHHNMPKKLYIAWI